MQCNVSFWNISHIIVPAKIDRALSSEDIMAREGSNISLICNATGYPDPTVTWTVHRSNSTEAQGMFWSRIIKFSRIIIWEY